MSENAVISPFQIIDWRILSFKSENGILQIPYDIVHNWSISAHIEKLPSEGSILGRVLHIEFEFSAEYGGNRIGMSGACCTACQLDGTGIDNAEEMIDDLMKRTAMTNSLSNLRVFLLQAGTLHQMGPKRVMLPFINLNNFAFDEKVTFTV